VRFNKGEKKNSDELAKKMAALCDIYVMDAFGTAHRAEASTHGVAKFAKVACIGPLLAAELEILGKALQNPARPLVAIVGGSKVSTKLTILKKLAGMVDQLIVVGHCKYFYPSQRPVILEVTLRAGLINEAKEITKIARAKQGDVPIPVDVICAKEISEKAKATLKKTAMVSDDDMILDVGPETSKLFTDLITKAKTIV